LLLAFGFSSFETSAQVSEEPDYDALGNPAIITANLTDVPVGTHGYRLVVNNNVSPISRSSAFTESNYGNNSFIGSFSVTPGITPPEITLEASRTLVRSGDSATISLRVNAPYTVTCQIVGVDGASTYTHTGTSASPVSTQSFTTDDITALRIITATCSSAGFSDVSERVDISVSPSVMEN